MHEGLANMYMHVQTDLTMPYTLVGSLKENPLAVKLIENRLYIYERSMCMVR